MSTFDDMKKFLSLSYPMRDKIVPCLVGPVGIGKTQAVLQHAEEVGANVVTIIASQILPNEVSGITMPDAETKSMEIYDHFRLSSLKDGDILFFDELLEADQMVLSACLTLIESRQMMSGRKLPDIQIIAATNPTVIPSSLKPNIRQRFFFKKFSPEKREIIRYLFKETGLMLEEDDFSIEENSPDFNILSPRSLTKYAQWIMSADDTEEMEDIAIIIDDATDSNLGSRLKLRKNDISPLSKTKQAIISSCDNMSLENDVMSCKSMKQLLEVVLKYPEVKDALENMSAEEMLGGMQDD